MGSPLTAQHEAPDVDGEAHALRRYVSARAHGRTHPEYSRYDEANGCWVADSDVIRPGIPT